jgi:hypothetical protein
MVPRLAARPGRKRRQRVERSADRGVAESVEVQLESLGGQAPGDLP